MEEIVRRLKVVWWKDGLHVCDDLLAMCDGVDVVVTTVVAVQQINVCLFEGKKSSMLKPFTCNLRALN